MNIIYIHQYFKTPSEPGGTRSYWISQELIKKGHTITMITANSNAVVNREEADVDGIKVIYLKESYNQSMSVLQRLKAFLGFVLKSIKEAKKYADVDLVIATSTPLTVGITALYMKKMRKVPFLFEVRDLWPEVPIQMGAFKNRIIIKITRWFEKTVYRNAEHVVALSPGMLDGVLKYISKEKTSMIPNMSKVDRFWIRERNLDFSQRLGLRKDTFKAIHFGALGLANGAHTIIESARLNRNDTSVEFIFAGGGSQEPQLRQLCKKYGLENVKFLGRFPMDQMSELVNICDVSIVSFLDLPILYTNSPNKLFDSLSVGKPIIVNSAGWTKRMVEENCCGYYVDPNKPMELVNKIKYLQSHPELVAQMQANSRKLAETTYDKSLLCAKFIKVVETVYNEVDTRRSL